MTGVQTCALPIWTYTATGNYDGKTVSGVKKGTRENYHYDAAETALDSSKDWKTKKTFTAAVSGLVTLYFQIKAGAVASTVHGRIVKAGIQVAAISTASKDYQLCSITLAVAAGDAILYQAKGDYILWAGSQFACKGFGVGVAANTCGIDFSGSPSQVIESNTYYTTDGTVEIPTESDRKSVVYGKSVYLGGRRLI